MANTLNAGSIGNIQELLEQKDEENAKLRVRVAELEDMIIKLSEDVRSLTAESELAKCTRKRTPKKEEEDNKPAKRVKREHNAVKPPSPSSSGKRMSAAPLEDLPIAESPNVRAASEDIVDAILEPDNDDDDPIPASRGPPRGVSEEITLIDAPAVSRPRRGVSKPAPKIKREIIDVDSLTDNSAPQNPQKDEQTFVRKFEVKKDTELVGTSITSRIEKIASRPVQVTLDPELRWRTFSRQTFLSPCFGGSCQDPCPGIAAQRVADHGHKYWLFVNPLFHPNAPSQPGYHGAWFEFDTLAHELDDLSHVRHGFVRMKPDEWLYVGELEGVLAEPLTPTEWMMQPHKVRQSWCSNLASKPWGAQVRAAVHLEKQLHRKPTAKELQDAIKDKTMDYKDVTPAEIMAAYDSDKQRFAVVVLKCMGYDEDFQRELTRKFETWVPPTSNKKSKSKGKTAKDTKERESGNVTDEDNAPEERVYVPRGTASRPKAR